MIFILPVSKKYHETATASRKESVPKIFTTRRMQRKRLQKTELSLVTLIAGTRKLYPPQSRVPKYFKSCFVLLRTAFVQQHILHRDLLGRCKLCARCWRHLCKKKKILKPKDKCVELPADGKHHKMCSCSSSLSVSLFHPSSTHTIHCRKLLLKEVHTARIR